MLTPPLGIGDESLMANNISLTNVSSSWRLTSTPKSGEFRLVPLLGVDVNRNDDSPKSLPIDFKNRQATKNTTRSQGKSILLRNRSNFYGFK